MGNQFGSVAFKIHVAVALLLLTTERIQQTGAVPGDEFAAAGVLYGSLGALKWLTLATALVAGVALCLQARRSRFALSLVLPIPLIVLGFMAPIPCLAAGLFLIEIGALRRRRDALLLSADRESLLAQGAEFGRWSPRHLLTWFPTIALLAAVGALLVTLVESMTYTRAFVPKLLHPSSLLTYQVRLIDLSIAFGAGLALSYCVPVLFVWLILRVLRRISCIEEAHQAVALGLAGFLALFTFRGVMSVVGDEVKAIGLLGHLGVLLSLLFLFWFHSVRRNLRHAPSMSASRLWCHGALGLLGWSTDRMPPGLRVTVRRQCIAWACLASVWLVALVYLSYPDLEDFRSKLVALGVVMAIHVIFLLQLAVLGAWRKKGGRQQPRVVFGAMTLLILAMLVASFRPISSNTALIIHEYARFGYVIDRGAIGRILEAESTLGLTSTNDVFQCHGSDDAVFPARSPLAAPNKRPPVFMVLWDAARPDHMSCYGSKRQPSTTPFMDAVAKESVVFDRAYSNATATTCGVRHLFTGNYSSRYMQAVDHDPFFVHALRKHGYKTFFITAFGTGFNGVAIDAFERQGPPASADGSRFINLTGHVRGMPRERPDSVKADALIEAWKGAHAAKGDGCLDGTFSFLHLNDTHFPWGSENAVRDYGSGYSDLYDGEMAKCDAVTGRVLDALREIGAYDDAIIIHLADHGTGLFEHGRWGGFLTYEEQIRIPLILKMPGVVPRRVNEVVSAIDIVPTLIGILDPGAPNPYDGVSLLPLMTGERSHLGREDVVSFCSFEDAYALIHRGRWKLHYHRTENYVLLFDLDADPLEQRNIADEEPVITADLTRRLGAFLWRGRGGYGNPYHYRDWVPPR